MATSKPKFNASIYLGSEYHLWPTFKEACNREGKTASRVLLDYVKKYLNEHDPGNPQTRFTSFTEGGAITMAGLEGRVRQRCLELKREINYQEILILVREEGVTGTMIKAMAERIRDWLQGRDVKVWG